MQTSGPRQTVAADPAVTTGRTDERRECILATPPPHAAGAALSLHTRSDVVIMVTWLVRLRWFALAGQSAAVLISHVGLQLHLPLAWLIGVMSVTALTNLGLTALLYRRASLPAALVPGLLLLDVGLLTALLAATGGPSNPFCAIYLTHVAMAVTVLRERTTWLIVGAALAGYLALFAWHAPLRSAGPLPATVYHAGAWVAVAITATSIAYFVGKLRQALRLRERELATMQDRVTRGERLTGLATLAAGAAHELGTPMGTIALVAHEMQRLADRYALPERFSEDVRLIRTELDRCRRILDRMNIDDTQDAEESPARFAVDALLDALREDLRPGQVDRLECHLSPTIREVTVRRQALLQVLGILLHNAFDATEVKDGPVLLTFTGEDKQLTFTIEDCGTGMTAEQLARVGEPFTTTKAPQRGMGLGLFLARRIVEHAGGQLVLRSAPGQGTIAILNFPGQHHAD